MLHPPANHALPVHPSLRSLFEGPARPYEGLQLRMFVGADKAYLEGMRRNAYFRTVDCTWASVAACRLSTANRRPVRGVFRLLAEKDPSTALAIITNGLVFAGFNNVVRNIWPLLHAIDVMPLLESADSDVRESAVAALGTLGKKAP